LFGLTLCCLRCEEAAKISADLHQQMGRVQSGWRGWTLRRMLAAKAVEARTPAAGSNPRAGEIIAVRGAGAVEAETPRAAGNRASGAVAAPAPAG
jgi:hypothetical protein